MTFIEINLDSAALFSLVCSRGPARVGAEREHSFADDGDNCIPTIDARDRKPYPRKQERTPTDIF